jgi:mono/diheme cytochrome c family protein
MSLQKFQHISKHARRAAATALAATALVVLWPTPTHAAGAAQIERGRYLVRISGCNDCHTEGYMAAAGKVDESRWLTGSQLGWQGPWGTTYAANLRISMQNLTLAQWLQAARAPRRPPMPWFALRNSCLRAAWCARRWPPFPPGTVARELARAAPIPCDSSHSSPHAYTGTPLVATGKFTNTRKILTREGKFPGTHLAIRAENSANRDARRRDSSFGDRS